MRIDLKQNFLQVSFICPVYVWNFRLLKGSNENEDPENEDQRPIRKRRPIQKRRPVRKRRPIRIQRPVRKRGPIKNEDTYENEDPYENEDLEKCSV